jgi:hypothetical protein
MNPERISAYDTTGYQSGKEELNKRGVIFVEVHPALNYNGIGALGGHCFLPAAAVSYPKTAVYRDSGAGFLGSLATLSVVALERKGLADSSCHGRSN